MRPAGAVSMSLPRHNASWDGPRAPLQHRDPRQHMMRRMIGRDKGFRCAGMVAGVKGGGDAEHLKVASVRA